MIWVNLSTGILILIFLLRNSQFLMIKILQISQSVISGWTKTHLDRWKNTPNSSILHCYLIMIIQSKKKIPKKMVSQFHHIHTWRWSQRFRPTPKGAPDLPDVYLEDTSSVPNMPNKFLVQNDAKGGSAFPQLEYQNKYVGFPATQGYEVRGKAPKYCGKVVWLSTYGRLGTGMRIQSGFST